MISPSPQKSDQSNESSIPPYATIEEPEYEAFVRARTAKVDVPYLPGLSFYARLMNNYILLAAR